MRAVLLACALAISIIGCAAESTSSPATSSPLLAATTPEPASSPSDQLVEDASPSPSPKPKPIPVCLAKQLTAKVTGWSGAAGHQVASVTITNKASHTCTVQGTPEVELLDVHGAILIDSQTEGAAGLPHIAAGAPAFHLAPKASLKTAVQADNYCGAAPALPTTIAFVLPASAGRLVAAPGPGGSVPSCMRAPGSLGSISMNGWSR